MAQRGRPRMRTGQILRQPETPSSPVKHCQTCGRPASIGYQYQMALAGGRLMIWTCDSCYEDLIRRDIRQTSRPESTRTVSRRGY